jgi:O-antigen ligase/tetratricopeptide (TPR) repeat protein
VSSSTEEILQKICDAGIAFCVLAVPLTMAGIREYGIALFVLCSFVAGIAWATQQLLSPTSHSLVMAATTIAGLAIGLVWLQLLHLPDSLLDSLSPFNSRYLTLWGSPAGRILQHTGWQQISMTPEATRSGLVLLIAYAIFFLTLVQRLRSQPDIDRLIKLVGISATVMCAIGIAQMLIGDDRFLWLIEHPTRTASWPAKGTFTNQNHFAHFLALGIGPLLWWWHVADKANDAIEPRTTSRSGRRRRGSRGSTESKPRPMPGAGFSLTEQQWPRILTGGCAGLLTLGAVCSLSRGGIAVFMVAAIVALCAVGQSWKSVLRLVIPLAIFLAAALIAFGTDELADRWNEIARSKSIDDLSHGRWALWAALAQAIPEFWPSGSGVGSHADIYPMWLSEQFDSRFSHAECGYLQILLETGVPGLMLLLSGIGLCGWWCVRGWKDGTTQQRRRITALAAGLVASVLHSLIDFVWYIPACMILTLVIMACICRCSQLTSPATGSGHVPGRRFAMVLAAGLLVAILPIGQLFADTIQRNLNSSPHWQSYHISMREVANGPIDERVDLFNNRLESLIEHLERCTTEDPFHHDAYTSLAPLYLQRFEQRRQASDNQMTLRDVRDTVREANFDSARSMHEWLARAFGDDIRDLYRAFSTARRALQIRPLRSEAYIVLSETAFLAGLAQPELEAIIDQAVRVRPHEPGVLYAAGILADDSNDVESAWQLWRHAASLDPGIARQIVSRFAEFISVDELIERLTPNKTTHWILYDVFGRKGTPEDQKAVAVDFAARHLEGLRQNDSESAGTWKLYATLLSAAEYHQDAIWCLRRAVRLRPTDLSARRLLARTLVDEGQLDDANRELRWLRLRLPDDRQISDWLQEVDNKLTAGNSGIDRNLHEPRTSESPQTSQQRTTVLPVSTKIETGPPGPPLNDALANPSPYSGH